jgi:hypothetical protein
VEVRLERGHLGGATDQRDLELIRKRLSEAEQKKWQVLALAGGSFTGQ